MSAGCRPGYHCWLSFSGHLTLLTSDILEQFSCLPQAVSDPWVEPIGATATPT